MGCNHSDLWPHDSASNRPHLSHRLHTLGSVGFRESLRPTRKLESSRMAELCRVGMVLRGEKRTDVYRWMQKPKHFRKDGLIVTRGKNEPYTIKVVQRKEIWF